MKRAHKMLLIAAGPLISASTSWADSLPTHRIPAALAVEAANETVAACARQGYRETAVVLDAIESSPLARSAKAKVSFLNETAVRCVVTAPVFIRSIARTTRLSV
jgi:hypothetical protein